MSISDRVHAASVAVRKDVDAVACGARRVGQGTVAGLLGGLVACWMMNQYQAIESRPVKLRKEELRLRYSSKAGLQPAQPASAGQSAEGDEPTVKLAQQVSRQLFEHELSPVEKKIAGPTVQYGYGALVGALYGGLSELAPSVSHGLGIPYATLLWLFGSEVAVPALGLAKPALQVPAEKHASDLATHFVYGITLDISRRIFRRVI